jgi:hypothetical protein
MQIQLESVGSVKGALDPTLQWSCWERWGVL